MTQTISSIIVLLSLTVSARQLLQEEPDAIDGASCLIERLYDFELLDSQMAGVGGDLETLTTLERSGSGFIPATPPTTDFVFNPPQPTFTDGVQLLGVAVEPVTENIYAVLQSPGDREVVLGRIGAPGFRENEITLVNETALELAPLTELDSLAFNCEGELFAMDILNNVWRINQTTGATELLFTLDDLSVDDPQNVITYNFDEDILYRVASDRGAADSAVLVPLDIDGMTEGTPIPLNDADGVCDNDATPPVTERISAVTYIGNDLGLLSCGATDDDANRIALFRWSNFTIIEEVASMVPASSGLIPTDGPQDFCVTPSCIPTGGGGIDCPDSPDSPSSDSDDSDESDDAAGDDEDIDDGDEDVENDDIESDSDSESESDDISQALFHPHDTDKTGYNDMNNDGNNDHNDNITVTLSASTLGNLWGVTILSLLLNVSFCWCFSRKNSKKTVITSTPLP